MRNVQETTEVLIFISERKDGNFDYKNSQFYSRDIINEDRQMLEIIFYCVFAGVISVLGSGANVINIIIFLKQGFKEATNISLFGLAVSDLLILLTLGWSSVCYNPAFQDYNNGFESLDFEHITVGWPQAILFRITSWITAFITLERCVCIALPMKVKDIITPKRTVISMVTIFVATFGVLSPEIPTVKMSPSFNTKRNRSLLALSFVINNPAVKKVTISFNIIAQLCSFIVVIICTSILALNLLVKSGWHRQVTSVPTNLNHMSLRDKRVMKIVICISCIFISCYFPVVINLILIINLSYGNSQDGSNKPTYYESWRVMSTIEAVNSATNIFVYYKMSSKFRSGFNTLFNITKVKIGHGK